eukprot:jgi/Tetstr1/447405/TSEL_034841.t1
MAFSRQLLKRRAAYAALFAAGAAFLQLGAVSGAPWNLTSYEFCRHVPLSGVPAEASGITYSPVTNSLYVITRNPRAVVEFNLEGKRLRSIPYDDLSDPEGITWMYDYTFAVAQEGRATAAISIMDLVPWRDSAVMRRKLMLRGVRCQTNFCFEGITYDLKNNVFYAVQEMMPMQVWKVSPGSGSAVAVLDGEGSVWKPALRDLAGAYFRANSSSGLYVLSQATQNVARVSFNGTISDKVKVRDNMVEGLTFTPDGHLMITVGEPNDLWVYSSTGECDWKPGSGYRIPRPPTQVQQERMANLRAPIDVDPDGGYCNWNGCDGTIQGNQWCNRDVDHCVGDCKGTWCRWDGIGQTISPDNYEPPPGATPEPTEPARTGFCSYGSSCADGRQGPELCHSTPNLCVLGSGCGGSLWCWNDGLSAPMTQSDFPENATATPVPTLDVDTIPDNVNGVRVEDESFRMMGYEAKVTLVLENITTTQFTPLQQLYFRQAVAHAAYGSPNGFLQVVFNTTTVQARMQWGIFKEFLLPATLERLARTQDRGLEDDVLIINVFLLGETRAHAQLLGNRTVDAVSSGQLKDSLALLRFQPGVDVSVANAQVTVADVAPQYFPNSIVQGVTYRDSYEELEIKVIGDQADPFAGGGETIGIDSPVTDLDAMDSSSSAPSTNVVAMAVSIAAAVVLALAIAGAIIICKRRGSAGMVGPSATAELEATARGVATKLGRAE